MKSLHFFIIHVNRSLQCILKYWKQDTHILSCLGKFYILKRKQRETVELTKLSQDLTNCLSGVPGIWLPWFQFYRHRNGSIKKAPDPRSSGRQTLKVRLSSSDPKCSPPGPCVRSYQPAASDLRGWARWDHSFLTLTPKMRTGGLCTSLYAFYKIGIITSPVGGYGGGGVTKQ